MNILIGCIGNIFLGDDGFGSEVAQRLARRPLPPGVTLTDFGLRGIDLTYALLDPHDLVILVDACSRGGAPGTIYLIEPDPIAGDLHVSVDPHSMNPMAVLRTVKSLGGNPGRILIVGCEPADLGGEEGKLGLSDVVLPAVDKAVTLIERLLESQPIQRELQPQ